MSFVELESEITDDFEENQYRHLLVNQNKKKKDDDNLLLSSKKDLDNKKKYGIMLFREYYLHGILINNYKIIMTSDHLDDIIKYCETLVFNIFKKIDSIFSSKYLIYEVEAIDPRLVSYNIIKSSNFPSVIFSVKPQERNMIKMFGNKILLNNILDSITPLKDFLKYQAQIIKMSKKELKFLCQEKKISIFFLTDKTKIIKLLLLNNINQYNIIE